MESELELKHKLLLAQAVVRLGSEDWSAVASLVQTAPLDTDALTPKLCEDTFTALVNEHQLDLSNTLVPEARASRKLAHKLYQDRIHEIASSLASRTSEAAKLQHDLTEITDGAWDDRVLQTVPPELIHEVITALPLSTSTPHALVGDSLAGSDPPSRPSSARSKAGRSRSSRKQTGGGGSPSATGGERERIPDSEERGGGGASEDERSVGIKDEEEDDAVSVGGRGSNRRGGGGGNKARKRKGADDGDDATSEAQDDGETDREMSVPSVAGGGGGNKKGSSSRSFKKGLTAPARRDRKGSKRKDSEQPEASPPPRDSRKRLKTDDPLDDSTPSTSSNRAQPKKTEDTKKNQQFRRAIGGLLETLQRFEKAWPFSTPVNKKDAPTYYDAIPRPVCLADIIRNVKQSDIVTNGEVQRDVALMFANAVQFNGVQDEIAECARLSWAEFERLMHTHIQQGFSNT